MGFEFKNVVRQIFKMGCLMFTILAEMVSLL